MKTVYLTLINKWVVNCNQTVTSVTLRADTVGIADSAFSGCSSLTNIMIPNGVISIDAFAFSNCSNLTRIIYCGSEEQWNAIQKNASWDNNTGDYMILFHPFHEWNESEIITAPTHFTFGKKALICSICGQTTSEDIAKISDHTYGDCITHSEEQHKKICACGDVQYASHIFDSDDDATCNDCGFERSIQITQLASENPSKNSSGCDSSVYGGTGLIFLLSIGTCVLRPKKKEL